MSLQPVLIVTRGFRASSRHSTVATGRFVPEAEIEESLRRVPAAVQALTPLSSLVATIDNTEDVPILSAWQETSADGVTRTTVYTAHTIADGAADRVDDASDGWEQIRSRFHSQAGLSAAHTLPGSALWQSTPMVV